MPAVDSDILYTRLFGHGVHNLYQFDDPGLLQIERRINESRRPTYITFHGAKMYTDAARFKVYENKGIFPNITKTTGLASLKTVLEEDAQFPATKSELIERQGWKVFDMTGTEHVHASVLLEKLHEKNYAGIEEVIRALE